jgi:hypothetical protein
VRQASRQIFEYQKFGRSEIGAAGSWEKTILEWRNRLSAPSRAKDALEAKMILTIADRRPDLEAPSAQQRGTRPAGRCIRDPFRYNLTCRPLPPTPAYARCESPNLFGFKAVKWLKYQKLNGSAVPAREQ